MHIKYGPHIYYCLLNYCLKMTFPSTSHFARHSVFSSVSNKLKRYIFFANRLKFGDRLYKMQRFSTFANNKPFPLYLKYIACLCCDLMIFLSRSPWESFREKKSAMLHYISYKLIRTRSLAFQLDRFCSCSYVRRFSCNCLLII